MAKRISTGLGADLKKGEALHKEIITDKLEADSNAPKTAKDLGDGVDAAKKNTREAVQPVIDHMKVVKKAIDAAVESDAARRRSGHTLASSAARTASPIWVVDTGVPPSGPIRSAVRRPSASTFSTAFSNRVASSPLSKE